MKYLLILLCFSFSSLSGQTVYTKPSNAIISWSSKKELTWNDFQGKIDPNIVANALTSYKIEIIPQNVQVDEQDRIQGYERLTVVTHFYKKQSWTTTFHDPIVLKHEQLHFDIAELYARKIRLRFSKLKSKKEARFSEYWNAYNQLWKACRMYQKQFDHETNHGRELQLNIIWEERIKQGLEMLSEFE